MQTAGASYLLSASDITGHLACGCITELNRSVADGLRPAPPVFPDPLLDALMERGRLHEAAFVEALSASGASVVRVEHVGLADAAVAATVAAMKAGTDIIVQGALRRGVWGGRPDILRRAAGASVFGPWSYETLDTKLARETTGATVLQLCLYSELLAQMQESQPEHAYAVTPSETGFREDQYRVDAYSAFYRQVKRELEGALTATPTITYPEPVAACDTCRWFQTCDKKRRNDDHPGFVAGLGKNHVSELREQGLMTLAAFAGATSPLAFKPKRGAIETYEALRRQAAVQLKGRTVGGPVWELIEHRPDIGLARLPAPSAGDIFLDFEGDPFVGSSGLEYLTGYVFADETGALAYRGVWATNAAEEKRAFETFIDFTLRRLESFPDLHIYHYAPYEPSALKRLMGRYATREDELDGLLRSERFVDLMSVVRNGVRCSVESYSIKKLEAFYGYERQTPLLDANKALGQVQTALELNAPISDFVDQCELVERYNKDDCRSTAALRDWLEQRRDELVASGVAVARPAPKSPDPTENTAKRTADELALAAKLTDGVPVDAAARTPEQHARWLLAQLLGWHRREGKSAWHEHFRLAAMSPEELMDDKAGLSGLVFEKEIEGGATPVHRYRFPEQESEVREGKSLRTWGGAEYGSVRGLSAAERWIDIKKRGDSAGIHTDAVYMFEFVGTDVIADALMRIGADVAATGMQGAGRYAAARDLLMRRAPMPSSGILKEDAEAPGAAAVRVIHELPQGVLAIQGPPGAGKTFTGAKMITALVAAGKTVGVTANSHKVISLLLNEAIDAALEAGVAISCLQRTPDVPAAQRPQLQIEKRSNPKALAAIGVSAQVVGGTAWFWSAPDAADIVDVLFVDEAAQMSLANVLALSQAAKTVVLLGDPQQLEQPSQGSHPGGSEVSALDHILSGAKTITASQGLFLAETWRLHPDICAFTSEVFYESRLSPLNGLERQRVNGSGRVTGAGLRHLSVRHSGNQNTSIEEVAAIRDLVEDILSNSSTWTDRHGVTHPITSEEILVVAPYNAQVFALQQDMPGARVGTVDKFQGQQAPVVIYSMTSSSAAEAPRGMEFLYSLNRLNVATSRAKCVCIVVSSPALLEAECRTPRQMELANALCRYREIATAI